MKNNRQALILLFLNLIYFLTFNTVFADNLTSDKEDVKIENIDENGEVKVDEMADELEKEKQHLLKLKAEFEKKYEEKKAEKSVNQNISDLSNDTEEIEEKNAENINDESDIKEMEEKEVTEIAEKDEELVDKKGIAKIINPFEIAENLYKLREYETALDIYKIIEKDKTENKKGLWISLQIANCYRKMKIYDKALEVYRKIANEQEATYWAKQALWYIKEIEWYTEIKDKLKLVEEK